MLDPASPIYEIVIGLSFFIFVLGFALAIPTSVGLYQDSKEEELKQNKNVGDKNGSNK
mgnify:CR=1 FL=1|tara:strand:+ start:388 stop:561 length:174 start_codon:yes stop_codon:yes gene_type:complete